jgi:hypothetical protein
MGGRRVGGRLGQTEDGCGGLPPPSSDPDDLNKLTWYRPDNPTNLQVRKLTPDMCASLMGETELE